MVTVIIPTTTSGLTHLTKLMPTLVPEKLPTIIVDNASLDGTSNYLGNYECVACFNKTKRPFAASCNQGAGLAKTKYVLFLNNDTRVTPNFANEMVKVAEERGAAMVGCPIFLMDQPVLQHAGVYFTGEGFPYELGRPIPDMAPGISHSDPRITATREVPAVTAVCVLVNLEKFNKVGGFDEGYVNGWEDNDLCLKMREAGESIWYCGTTRIYHRLHGSKLVGRFAFENQNRDRYDEKWVKTGKVFKLISKVSV